MDMRTISRIFRRARQATEAEVLTYPPGAGPSQVSVNSS